MAATSPPASSVDSVREILAGGQPWFPVAAYRGDIAEILFDADEDAEAQALARELREHGFEADVHHTVALSGHAPEFLHLTIDTAEKWMVQEILKGTLPTAWNWLVSRLRSERNGGVRAHQALLFQQRMRPWLDTRFGEGGWSYDPDTLECCKLGGHTILALVEEKTGTEIVLSVQGLDGPIEEIPFSRKREREDEHRSK